MSLFNRRKLYKTVDGVTLKVLPRPLKSMHKLDVSRQPPNYEIRYQPKEKIEPVPEIKIERGYHWFIGGVPGAGKTTAVIAILKNILDAPAVFTYILDSKNKGDYDEYPHAIHYSGEKHPGILHDASPERTLIWHVTIDNLAEVDAWLKMILADGYNKTTGKGHKANIVIDELTMITPSDIKKTPEGYKLIAKVGRLSGITMLTGTQDLAGIPRQAIGMATHGILLNVVNRYDKMVARGMMNMEQYLTYKHEHGMWYRNLYQSKAARYFSNIQDFIFKK